MVIVEYCRFGNLQTFLVKHRPHFVDQVDKNTDLIDQNIHINELRWSQNTAYNGYNRYTFYFLFAFSVVIRNLHVIYGFVGFKFRFRILINNLLCDLGLIKIY